MASTNTSIPFVYIIWTMFLLFFGSVQLCLCFRGNISKSGSCIERERKALLNIRKGIYGAHSWLSWNGKDCCRWAGVRCDIMTGHVLKLELHYPYPCGDEYSDERCPRSEVSPSLLHLRHLKYLDLSTNNFSGAPIPDFIGSLANLEYLILSYAGFAGTIPHQLGNLSNLLYLDLASNDFNVDNLIWLAQIRSLQHLDMSDVDLSKASNWIHVINMLPSLSVLHLSGAALSGLSPTQSHINFTSLTILDLSSNNFASSISDWLFNLSSLEHLDLGSNQFSGNIPLAIGNLKKLHVLDLSSNNFSRDIPETVSSLKSLESLDLRENSISGEIPRTMGNLCNLSYFDASGNNISGEITGFMEGLSRCSTNRLRKLALNDNNLNGPLPSQIGELRSLVSLDVSYNSLSGSIPASLGKLSALSVLSLASNFLEGALTEAHFANLTGLSRLDLSDNSLTVNVSQDWLLPFNAIDIMMASCPLGPKFPSWLRNQTELSILDLSNAGISENFPDWFLVMCPIGSVFNIAHNHIKGNLPSFGDCQSRRNFNPLLYLRTGLSIVLDLSNNSFSGPIPPTLVSDNIGDLLFLLLAHNRISGSIPSAFCELNQLAVLNLADNDLSGVLPDCWNNSSVLRVIDFSDNKLSGGIPSSMGSLSQLMSLHLRNNSLSGKIPLSLKQCKQLITIDLGNNELSGSIPEWIGESLSSLRILRLRSNMLYGNIPGQLSLLASLQVLDLADNRLSGTLPPSFGNFTAMAVIQNGSRPVLDEFMTFYYTENLLITTKGLELTFTTVLSLVTSLDLSDNNISGEIPEGFTNLRGLHFLNLSGNHLTGRIPKNIGAMGQLESLDLSMNNLSGTIPASISYLNFLEHLNLSHNNLSGRIPSGYQLRTLVNDPSTYIGNQYLCGQPLPEKCPGDEPAGGPAAHGREEKQEENENDSEMIWFYVGLSPGFVVGFWGFLCAVMLKKSTRYAYIRFLDRICDWIHMVVTINSARPKSKRNRGRR